MPLASRAVLLCVLRYDLGAQQLIFQIQSQAQLFLLNYLLIVVVFPAQDQTPFVYIYGPCHQTIPYQVLRVFLSSLHILVPHDTYRRHIQYPPSLSEMHPPPPAQHYVLLRVGLHATTKKCVQCH
ncbi:MAG: hypothetical protein ACD_81C00215G0001 [uncultured bacterium]|nr:MAG: hypothetical protein ACD_81C00215G0001 [uncultured bacterium]